MVSEWDNMSMRSIRMIYNSYGFERSEKSFIRVWNEKFSCNQRKSNIQYTVLKVSVIRIRNRKVSFLFIFALYNIKNFIN